MGARALVFIGGGAFTVWCTRGDTLVGALTLGRDEDYERGRELIALGNAS
ncbi:MAG: hypothetical protein ABSC56_04045 [Solirubrobacteraceae bacterium]|jgi:hypothetical protein